MEDLNNNDNYENCRKEMLNLRREIQISKLLLYQKQKELNDENIKNGNLNNEFVLLINKINELMQKVSDYESENRKIQEENNKKKLEQEELFRKINELKLTPSENCFQYNDRQLNDENFEVFQKDI